MKKEHIAILFPAALATCIFFASGTSKLARPEVEIDLIGLDKLAHFLVFGLLATSIARIRQFRQAGWKGTIAAAAIVIVFGALDEFRQSFTPGRSVELGDWIADCAGAIVATQAYYFLDYYRRLLEAGSRRKKATTASIENQLPHKPTHGGINQQAPSVNTSGS